MEAAPKKQSGHRERLKSRFVRGDKRSQSEEALLELLLTYAIPQKDVQPLAARLLATFGNLQGVLTADLATLSQQEGIKEHTAILLKLVDWIRMQVTQHHTAENGRSESDEPATPMSGTQASVPEKAHAQPAELIAPTLFPATSTPVVKKAQNVGTARPLSGTGLFSKALMQETVNLLPLFPDTLELDEARAFLKQHLPFSGETTRQRSAQYITRRMFPGGVVDRGLLVFARAYANQQALREACFYRFCKAEPLMAELIEQLLLPSLGAGQIPRSQVREYLQGRFPGYASTKDCSLAAVDALVGGGLAIADRETLSFAYREPTLAGFAFFLHSEFPEPGMFNIAKLEQNRYLRAMLWRPESLLTMLYELRNHQVISKISEIDALRQFTTIYALDQVCELLAQTRME